LESDSGYVEGNWTDCGQSYGTKESKLLLYSRSKQELWSHNSRPLLGSGT
jgi:hypothetical protein